MSLENREISGGEAVMRTLVNNGVNTIFGYPGGAIMPTYDALFDHEGVDLRHVLTRHEQGATHAAEGYAQMKHEPGVVLVTSGPGLTNAVTGIGNAQMDSTPLLVISGQVARGYIGTQAFQEAPATDITRPITKSSRLIKNAAEIQDEIRKGISLASSGRPGPVHIDIPKDVQAEMVVYESNGIRSIPEEPVLSPEALLKLQQAADLLNQARKPYILAGHGILISQATQELLTVAEKAGIPVANTLLGLSSFPQEHPLFAGMLGMHGRYGANVLTNEADVILAVGMRFDDRVTGKLSEYAPNAKIIHIDIDPTQLNRLVKADVAVNSDAKVALSALLSLLDNNTHPDWVEQFRRLDLIEYNKVTRDALAGTSEDLRMAEVIHALSSMTSGEAVIVVDVGQHQMIAAQYQRSSRPDSFITSGGMGTMGFALPAAIGAQIAAPERQVVAVIGDGSFQMNIQELGTIMQERLPVKMIILDNQALGMVRQWQDLFHGGRRSFVDMQSPNFVALAGAYGIPGERLEGRKGRANLKGALDRMLTAQGPYLLHVDVEKAENVFPMMPSGASVNGMRLR